MTMIVVSGECFFWYQLIRVVPDKIKAAVKCLNLMQTYKMLGSTGQKVSDWVIHCTLQPSNLFLHNCINGGAMVL